LKPCISASNPEQGDENAEQELLLHDSSSL
jgi:hypothetical protein